MVSLKFHDVYEKSIYTTIEVNEETKNLCLLLKENNSFNSIILDKKTAIKFSKELRKQIALIIENE